ncbi:hypothetical protein P8452_15215 [Trifolium repens]|nr:hypothetical protein P8452_15215 [Trifolium repens]
MGVMEKKKEITGISSLCKASSMVDERNCWEIAVFNLKRIELFLFGAIRQRPKRTLSKLVNLQGIIGLETEYGTLHTKDIAFN